MIPSPLSRTLAVADPERSVAFYRDILGFVVRPVQGDHGFPAAVDVGSGPARIQLGRAEAAYDSVGERSMRSSLRKARTWWTSR